MNFWPERVVFFLAVLIFTVLVFLGAGSRAPDAGQWGSDAWFDALFSTMTIVGLKVLLPIWLVLRAFNGLFVVPFRNR